jgi:hypothetical protein
MRYIVPASRRREKIIHAKYRTIQLFLKIGEANLGGARHHTILTDEIFDAAAYLYRDIGVIATIRNAKTLNRVDYVPLLNRVDYVPPITNRPR